MHHIATFLSTQPKRAATITISGRLTRDPISIHAAQEGCDRGGVVAHNQQADFNPRSPNGLRHPDKLTTKALKRAYKDLVEACAKLETEAVDKALWTAVLKKSRYYAELIAGTESARAWYEGYMADSSSDDYIVGFKYNLSSAHKTKHYDICDVYANADFGYGKGVFPKGKQPNIPVHPHCMCYYSKIF